VEYCELAMFGSIKNVHLKSSWRTRTSEVPSGQRDRLTAITALLIRVATVDHRNVGSQAGQTACHFAIELWLDDTAAARLISDADAIARSAIDLYRFTRPLNEVLDDEGRRPNRSNDVGNRLRGSLRSTNSRKNIIWRAADLLSVSTRQRVELRQRIVANMEALTPAKIGWLSMMMALFGCCR